MSELQEAQAARAAAERHLADWYLELRVRVEAVEACRDRILAVTRPRGLPAGELTSRERQVLRYLCHTRLTGAEIAAALFITANTAKTHVKSIYVKLGVDCRAQAKARVAASGLLSHSELLP